MGDIPPLAAAAGSAETAALPVLVVLAAAAAALEAQVRAVAEAQVAQPPAQNPAWVELYHLPNLFCNHLSAPADCPLLPHFRVQRDNLAAAVGAVAEVVRLAVMEDLAAAAAVPTIIRASAELWAAEVRGLLGRHLLPVAGLEPGAP